MKMSFISTLVFSVSACLVGLPSEAQTSDASAPDQSYVAQLYSMNTDVTGQESSGKARFTISGDTLSISITAEGVPAGIAHLQHFHGFKDGSDASCATQDDDANQDGIIDVIETERVSGTTMVPFTDDPVSMEIVVDTYPQASAEGSYRYVKTVSLDRLEEAFAEAFDGENLNLDRRVVYIHGVLPEADLPESAASLGTIPAQVTLPIACGEIARVAIENKD